MNNNLSDYQRLLLQVLTKFDDFCRQNHIQYFAWYGTLIGAIRHKGFIPWDDDIDVAMKREDYDRFISLRDRVGNGYKIGCYLDGESPYPFAKFYSTEETIWEYPQFCYIIGPWIDVFPLDRCCGGKKDKTTLEAFHYSMWKYRKAVAYSPMKEIWSNLLHGNVLSASVKLLKKVRYAPFKKKYIRQAEKVEERLRSLQGDAFGDYSEPLDNKAFPEEWLNDFIRVGYEDRMIDIPAEYDKILSYMYGDYMTPPPVENRKGHEFYYINLNENLTRDAIVSRYKERLSKVPGLSIKVMLDEYKHRAKAWRSNQ